MTPIHFNERKIASESDEFRIAAPELGQGRLGSSFPRCLYKTAFLHLQAYILKYSIKLLYDANFGDAQKSKL